jgi:hypothetical protein
MSAAYPEPSIDAIAHCAQNVGMAQVGERIWLVTFMRYDFGYFVDETCRLEPVENPFGRKCYHSARNKLRPIRPE